MKLAVYLVATLTGVAMLLAPSMAAPIIYSAYECEAGITCNIGGHGTSSGSGPSNADFQAFYAAHLGFDTSSDTFTWTKHTNANGYYFGHVDDYLFSIHGAYLWNGSSLTCCLLDDPYAITDGNDRNHFIGEDINGMSNFGQYLYPAFLAGPGGPMALKPVDYVLDPFALALIGDSWWSVQFMAIDNDDNILARWSGPTGWLVFYPQRKVCCSVPEPASALLMLPVLAGLGWRLKRRG